MGNDSTVYVGLDVHKGSITAAYAIGMGEVELLGKIGTGRRTSIACASAGSPRRSTYASSMKQALAAMASTANWSRGDSTAWCARHH